MILITSIYEDVGVLHVLHGAESDLFMQGDFGLELNTFSQKLQEAGAKIIILRMTRVFREAVVAEMLKQVLTTGGVQQDSAHIFRFPNKDSYYEAFGNMGVFALQDRDTFIPMLKPNQGHVKRIETETGHCSYCNNPDSNLIVGLSPPICIGCKKINEHLSKKQ